MLMRGYLLCLLAAMPVTAAPLPYLGVPPTWESRVVYYQSFSGEQGGPEVNLPGLQLQVAPTAAAGGILGDCGVPGQGKGLVLQGGGLSPHLPLAISFWWSLLQDADKDTGVPLFHLASRTGGFVSHFTRTGPWCGLTQAAAVLQVHNMPGLQNVNAIYDSEVWQHLDGKAGVWHHTALVFSGASRIELYTDGKLVYEVRITGREFSESDAFTNLALGTPHYGPAVALDEVMVLNRPLAAGEIAEYVAALRAIKQAWGR